MRHSKLSEHTFKKGTFITPLNSIQNIQELEDTKSWTYGRMPEYIWIGLILNHYGREEGLKKSYSIISTVHSIAPTLKTARLSQLLLLDSEEQEKIWKHIVLIGAKEALTPLTVFLTISRAPIFAKYFYCPDKSPEERINLLVQTMSRIMDHQSEESTDIRFVVLYFYLLSGRMHLQKEQIGLLEIYPNTDHKEEIMHMARPLVRSLEMMILSFEKVDAKYLKDFWRCVSELTECNLFAIAFPTENRSISVYMEHLQEVFNYLASLFSVAEPLDEKMNVLLGIATYSYKRLKEIYENDLFNSVSGRSCIRVLIEDYIMMKYLVKNETLHENIWREYQIYGMGLYKLVLTRHREIGENKDSHFDENYIEALVNEYKDEEFINMDTRYFDNQNIRLKAEAVGEKELYGLYYDYDSSFEHGLWGAIREVALLKCGNPAHRYHCIPDVEGNALLKSVMPDCIMVMKKTLAFINDLYGIPEQLLDEVMNYEIKPFTEEDRSDAN